MGSLLMLFIAIALMLVAVLRVKQPYLAGMLVSTGFGVLALALLTMAREGHNPGALFLAFVSVLVGAVTLGAALANHRKP